MTNEQTKNSIALIVVITLCFAFLALFGLAFLKIIDPAPLVALVTGAVASLLTYVLTNQKASAELKSANARAAIAEMRVQAVEGKAK